MSKLFGKKKKQGQSNDGGAAAGGGTGTEAAALQGPKRGLGDRIQDGWDRFKYWAGGGGKAVNNKTRNWLADGKEGSWRRNKAERLADKEYESGLQRTKAGMIKINNNEIWKQANNKYELDKDRYKFPEETYKAARGIILNRVDAASVDDTAKELTEAGITDPALRAELLRQKAETMYELRKAGGDLYDDYCYNVKVGGGNAEVGALLNEITNEVEFSQVNLPSNEKMNLREMEARAGEIYKEKFGEQSDKEALGETYQNMLLRRAAREKTRITDRQKDFEANSESRGKILQHQINYHKKLQSQK